VSRPVLSGVLAVLLVAMPFANAKAQTESACDRACLRGLADQYLSAVAARKASSLPLTDNVRYTENGQELELTDGFWGTANAVGNYKQHFVDTQAGQVGVFATMKENDALVLTATRLKVDRRKISEIETIVLRQSGGSITGGESGAQRLDKSGKPTPLWEQLIPTGERMSREELIKTANKYFVALQKNDGKGEYPFTDDCVRFENGTQATGSQRMAELADKAESNPTPNDGSRPTAFGYRMMSYGCKKQFETGFMRMVDRIRDRRFPIVDVERGAVFTLVFFDHSGTVHQVTTTDGKTHPVGLKAPFTWEMAEAFKIEKGQIRYIEAVFTQSPYGMKPNWSK